MWTYTVVAPVPVFTIPCGCSTDCNFGSKWNFLYSASFFSRLLSYAPLNRFWDCNFYSMKLKLGIHRYHHKISISFDIRLHTFHGCWVMPLQIAKNHYFGLVGALEIAIFMGLNWNQVHIYITIRFQILSIFIFITFLVLWVMPQNPLFWVCGCSRLHNFHPI